MSNKAKKPIYKRVWPYVVAGLLIVGGIAGGSSEDGEQKEPKAPTIVTAEPIIKETPAPEAPAVERSMPVAELPDETAEPAPDAAPLQQDAAPVQQAPVTVSAPQPVQEPVAVLPEPVQEPVAVLPEPEQTAAPEDPAPVETPNVKGCFITPTGSKYHFDKECAGPNAIPISLDDAIARGYTPCATCAGG